MVLGNISYNYKKYNGREFNHKFTGVDFFLMTDIHEIQPYCGLMVKTGLNRDFLAFDPSLDIDGGYNFYTLENLPLYLNKSVVYFRKVTLPNDAIIHENIGVCGKIFDFTTDQIILSENQDIISLSIWSQIDYCLNAVKLNGLCLKYINQPTLEMQLIAVRQNGFSLMYISEPTDFMYLEALKQNGSVLTLIPKPTDEMCWIALNQNVMSIRYIANPNEEM